MQTTQYTKIQEVDGVLRVVAIEDFDDVKVGDIGGVVTENVEIVGTTWVDYDCTISGNIKIVDSKIYFSDVSSDSRGIKIIEESTIRYSTIKDSLIYDSTVICSIVKDSNIIDNAHIEESAITHTVLSTGSTYRSIIEDSRILIDISLNFVKINDNDFIAIQGIKPFGSNIVITKNGNGLMFILDGKNLTKDELLENVKFNLDHYYSNEQTDYIQALSTMLDNAVILLET